MKKHRKKKNKNRWLALTLCLCLLAGTFSLDRMTYAAETDCTHQHEAECGYAEAVEGQPCTFTHEHDGACGYTEAAEATPCPVEAAHIHDTAVCGYVEAVESQPCTHAHDESCGGLTQDIVLPTCTLNEGCTLPAGHEDDCEFPVNTDNIPVVYNSMPAASAPGGNAFNADRLATALGSNNVTVNGSTVTLNTDVRLTGYILVYNNVSLTLDLNGHTLGADDSINVGSLASILGVTGATLTIKNGTISKNSAANATALRMYGNGIIQLENVNLIEGDIVSDSSSTLQINTSLAVNGALKIGGTVKIANGATLDMRNGTIPVNSSRTFVIFKTDNETWNITVPLVLANAKTSAWFVELDTAASGLPDGYALAYTLTDGTSEWKLQAPGYKVNYRLPAHVHATSTPGSVAPGDTLTLTLTADPGYAITTGNVNVFKVVNEFRDKRSYDYNEETGVLTVNNVNTNLDIEILEKIIVTLETVENGRIEIEDAVGTKYYSDILSVYMEDIIIRGIPDSGYQLSQLTVNGNEFTSGSVHNVLEPITIRAVFEPIPAPPVIAPEITTTTLDNGQEKAAYQDMLGAGGTTPITWSIAAGRLPDGLTLSADGHITGTPNLPGTFHFTVRAENSAGSDEKAFTIEIRAYPGGDDFSYRTLTDSITGIQVSGIFGKDAVLSVNDNQVLHEKGTCPACDTIRARQEAGELVALYDIRLFTGSYQGDMEVSIPVGEAFNNQTLDFLHCSKNVLDSRTITVSNGAATGTFSSLSPFAVAKPPTVITDLPKTHSMVVGESVSWIPSPAGGTWSFDKNYLEMTQNGGSYTFQALKEGNATAAYTANKVTHTITITINSSHTHKYEGDWQHDDTNHWQLCSCGEAGPKAPHSGGTANCHEKAVCEVCKAAYGNLEPGKHDGGTELRNVKTATRNAEGYTGDTYCLGCGELLTRGKAVPRTVTPQTGDHTVLWPWFALMLAGLTGSGIILIARKRHHKSH